MSTNLHACWFLEDVAVSKYHVNAVPGCVSITLKTAADRLTLDLSPAQWRAVVEAVLPHLPAGEVITDV